MTAAIISQVGELRFLRLTKVLSRVDLSKTTWYELVKGGSAPAPCKIGRNSLWVESEIERWMLSRMRDRRAIGDDDDEL
jgi:predicted DNA-binding transcriptional regulator AlpA